MRPTKDIPRGLFPGVPVDERLQNKRTTRLVNQWHNRLSRVFPELALIASRRSAAWVLRLMRKYPTPQRIAAARASSLATIPHIDADRAEQLQTAARKTTGSHFER